MMMMITTTMIRMKRGSCNKNNNNNKNDKLKKKDKKGGITVFYLQWASTYYKAPEHNSPPSHLINIKNFILKLIKVWFNGHICPFWPRSKSHRIIILYLVIGF